jgi:hypothetical protein
VRQWDAHVPDFELKIKTGIQLGSLILHVCISRQLSLKEQSLIALFNLKPQEGITER